MFWIDRKFASTRCFLPSSALAKTQPQLGCAGIKPNFSNRPPSRPPGRPPGHPPGRPLSRPKKYEAGTFEPGLQNKSYWSLRVDPKTVLSLILTPQIALYGTKG